MLLLSDQMYSGHNMTVELSHSSEKSNEIYSNTLGKDVKMPTGLLSFASIPTVCSKQLVEEQSLQSHT